MSFLSNLPSQQDLPLPVHFRKHHSSNTHHNQQNTNMNNNQNEIQQQKQQPFLEENVFAQPFGTALLTNEHTALLCIRSDLHVLTTWLTRLNQVTQTQLQTRTKPLRGFIAGLQNLYSELLSYWEIEHRVVFPCIRDSKCNTSNSQAYMKMTEIIKNLQRSQQQIKYQFNEMKSQHDVKLDMVHHNFLKPVEIYLNIIMNDLLPLVEHNLSSSELEDMTRSYLKVHGEVHRKCINDHKCMPNERHQQPFSVRKLPIQANPASASASASSRLSSKL
jgi:iron-sulfur cluster repair protein YtfE (RIC family)